MADCPVLRDVAKFNLPVGLIEINMFASTSRGNHVGAELPIVGFAEIERCRFTTDHNSVSIEANMYTLGLDIIAAGTEVAGVRHDEKSLISSVRHGLRLHEWNT